MSSLRIAFVLGFFLSASLAAQEPAAFAPQAGLLMLRNGQVLKGEITRAGDHYIVTFGVGGEVKIAAKEVETQCADLEAAYDYKLRRLSGEGAGPHLDLAEWCLRQGLHRQVAEQLSLAIKEEPENKRIGLLERRLQFAVETPTAVKAAPVSSTIVAPEQLEKKIRELPKGTLERFSTLVQPMLNNRCATSHCHGATTTSDFRLLRPPAGLGSSQRFTQRNLYAALAYVDRDNPDNSPLLTKPQGVHGGAAEPVFDARSKSQVAELKKWLEQLGPPKEIPAPPTVDPQVTELSTTMRSPGTNTTGTTAPNNAAPWDAPNKSATDKPAAGNPSSAAKPVVPPPQTKPAPPAWQPRDAFDPEIFNRQNHKR